MTSIRDSVKVTNKASWPDVGYHSSHPRQGQVKEHWRGVCVGKGNGVHVVKHGKCARGDIWLQDGCHVGVCSRGSIRHVPCMRAEREMVAVWRGWQWWHGVGSSSGMWRAGGW